MPGVILHQDLPQTLRSPAVHHGSASAAEICFSLQGAMNRSMPVSPPLRRFSIHDDEMTRRYGG
ncbi:hypothetical protein CGMCC3_g13955 [Colletotrichum fructicola]|nr:uncharacterized protein CGMCC3_g13955 [Colletotrichum fructicola]KAE9569933.1 hypothetical protein CGMCC3_g13955 [Colletotrichum fructicola]